MRSFATGLVFVLLCAGRAAAAGPEIWATDGEDGSTRNFVLWPNGEAVMVSSGRDATGRGVRGFWHGTDRSRFVVLESGAGAEIRIGQTPVVDFDDGSSERSRVQARPASAVRDESVRWLGVWVWRKPNDPGTRYVALLSDGSAYAEPGSHGRWVRVPRGIRVEWHDGAIDLLQFDAAGALLRSWPRGFSTRSHRPEPTRPQRVGADGFEVTP